MAVFSKDGSSALCGRIRPPVGLLFGLLAVLSLSCSDGGDSPSAPPPPTDTYTSDGQEPNTDTGPPTSTDADTHSGDTHPEADTWEPPPCVVGLPCNDDNQCTHSDACVDNLCLGTPYTCDDGRECTENQCDGDGGCLYPVIPGFCLIHNVCVDHGTLNSDNECERCDTDQAPTAWSERADSEDCEDGNPCTFGDYCKKGACKGGLAATCDDDNDCTADSCSDFSGCINEPASGDCDDDNPCTPSSVCSGGVCHAPVQNCDDNNPCTADTCLPDLGCEHVVLESACEDGNACTTDDACVDGTCVSGPAADCSDGTPCTHDECDPIFGCFQTLTGDPCCVGAVHLCDDDNPCTTDQCDPEGGCAHPLNDGPCEDGDLCTGGDHCVNGACISGSESPCEDGNPCTVDICDASVGCQHSPGLGACNDGIDCTTADTCINSQCVGDASECKCSPEFSATVGKVTALHLGLDGNPGSGLDVDQDSSTCAPEGKCSQGIDNQLSMLAGFLNSNLEKEVNNGGLILLAELSNVKTDGTPFTFALYAGKKASSCDHSQGGCDYLADDSTLTEDCEPLITLDNATIVNGKFTAGGPGYQFTLQVPLFGDNYLDIVLFNGTVIADIVLDGDQVVSVSNGVIGGAVPKSVFVTALEYVDPDDLPAPKATIVQLIDLIIKNDIDTGPPVGPDAASIGLLFEAVQGAIVGVD